MARKSAVPLSFPVVAVGASAGGLEAYTALFKALPANSGMGFVLIQHLEPTHESALAQLLSKATAMPVVEASEGVTVQPDRVYVIPPNKGLTIHDGKLRLTQRDRGMGAHRTGLHHPIDDFCLALAEDRRSDAIGVLLSGSGSDGTLGFKAIKAAGGITFAQEPKTAQWPLMPESAISAGAADFVMSPRRIAAELVRISGGHSRGERAETPDGPELDRICLLLRTTTGVDFRLYKQATVSRRVARRMTLVKASSLAHYADILKKNPEEAQALGDDIFIHVTGFFRDPQCYQALRKQVFSRWRTKRNPEEPIRVWVPGCSTGEEVYSLAMLLIETLGENKAGTKIQMFGTDISEPSIEHARAGIYADSAVAGVSGQRLKRFFVREGDRWQIGKSLRGLCVFARHDLAKDPPFSKLDLISCRNVLIYMGPALQRRTLSAFQYALRPGGCLFLGKSEAISEYSDVFAVKDRIHRFFIRKPGVAAGHRFDSVAGAWTGAGAPRRVASAAAPGIDFQREGERILLERYAPPALIVDPDLRIVHFQGEVSPFLAPATGQPSFHLLKMVRTEFIVSLRTLISQARRKGVAVSSEGLRCLVEGAEKIICIDVIPLKTGNAAKPELLVAFRVADSPDDGARASRRPEARRGKGTKALEQELAAAREYLRSLIGEHETAQEEMKAANEEILSSNEELQSTNEELETAKEELQSSNEELVSLNDELQHRNSELSVLGNDLSNVLAGVEIPVVVLDSDLRIRRFTPVAEKVLNLIGTDVGRPFSQIASNLNVADWEALFAEATTKLQIVEREVQDRDGHWYALRIRPYRTIENRIDGILLSLVDIDSVKKSLEELRHTRDYAGSIVETIHESLLVLDAGFRVETANRTFYQTFRVTPEETIGRPLYELGQRQWDLPPLRKLLEEILPQDAQFDGFEVDFDFPSIGFRQMLINARRIHPNGNGSGLMLLAIEDVTETRRAEKDLRRAESTLEALVNSAAQGILAVDATGTIVLTNRMTETMFGFAPNDLIGQPLDRLIPPENRARYNAFQQIFFAAPRVLPMGAVQNLVGYRKDGTRFPVEISLSFVDAAEGRLGVAFVSDISQRRYLEDALLIQRERVDKVLAALPGAIYAFRLHPDGRTSLPYASPGFRTLIPELPDLRDDAAPLFAMMHPDDAEWIDLSIRESARTMTPWHGEYRLLTASRGPLWLEGSSAPAREIDGSVYWYGLVTDVTERKKAEAATARSQMELQTLTTRLIAAQEDQSKYLARELHDVFSQKLAVLAMDISALERRLPAGAGNVARPLLGDLRKLGAGVTSLAQGLHQMSRQIHPSILDDLGLAAALKDECQVFSEMQRIPVRFRSVKVPLSLPEDVALCLYRVAQEILRNIAKHAGATEIRFTIAATASQIRLSVQDDGEGFDLAKARRKRGLGLLSMEERVRIVNGVFEIDSQAGKGTKVEVRVPLQREINDQTPSPAGGRSSNRDRGAAAHPRIRI